MSEKIEVGYFYVEPNPPAPIDVMLRTLINQDIAHFLGKTPKEAFDLEDDQGSNPIELKSSLYRLVVEKVEQTV